MKKTLLIALLLIPFLGISQTTKPIDGFLGIKFGASRASVIAALNARGGIMDKEHSTAERILYNNITLGHRGARGLFVSFVDDKAYLANFVFVPELESQTLQYFYALINDINEIYGTGHLVKHFQEPYNDNDDDGIKIDALKDGKDKFYNFWQSKPSDNSVGVEIRAENLYIDLLYKDEELGKLADSKQKAKEKSDY